MTCSGIVRDAGVLLVLAALGLGACAEPAPAPGQAGAEADRASPPAGEVVDLARFFEDAEGTFVLWSEPTGRVVRHDPARAARRFLPASTFKIPHTLIALETGVLTGPEQELPWDSAMAPPEAHWPRTWLGSQTLRSAFRNSVYWYYQEVARRIGEERMRQWLARFDYGNRDIGGGIDRFWLWGDMRISPDEQVGFLRRVYRGDHGVSPRATALLKELMVLKETPHWRLSGKTGTADVTPNRELGWLVGWLEEGDEVHFYALNMEGETVWERWPPQRRAELVEQLLREVGVLPPPGVAVLVPPPVPLGPVRLAATVAPH